MHWNKNDVTFYCVTFLSHSWHSTEKIEFIYSIFLRLRFWFSFSRGTKLFLFILFLYELFLKLKSSLKIILNDEIFIIIFLNRRFTVLAYNFSVVQKIKIKIYPFHSSWCMQCRRQHIWNITTIFHNNNFPLRYW